MPKNKTARLKLFARASSASTHFGTADTGAFWSGNANGRIKRGYNPGKQLYRRGIIYGILAGCMLSTNGILIRQIEEASEWHIIFYRSLTLTTMLICILGIRHRGRLYHAILQAGRTALFAGLGLMVSFIGYIFSIMHTTVANTLFLLTAAPFFTAIIARIVLKEQVRRATWVAMTATLAGITLMVANGLAIGTLFGNLMGLLTVCAHACFTVALRHGRNAGMMPAVCFGGAFAAVASAFMVENFTVPAHDLLVCIAMGIVGIGFGFILFTIASRNVPAAELVLLALTEVVLGPIWVWIGVGELPSLMTLIGGGVMLNAILLHALTGMRRSGVNAEILNGNCIGV